MDGWIDVWMGGQVCEEFDVECVIFGMGDEVK